MAISRKLTREFYARDTIDVARELVGTLLVRAGPRSGQLRVGRIVETEAYKGPSDRAAHSWRGRTPRTAIMFGPPGFAYVYMIYGVYFCLNVVTEPIDHPCAVLLRAIEPVAGIDAATWGPGLLCRAMEIDRALNGADLRGETLWIERPTDAAPAARLGRSARIGVEYAGAWAQKPWRFFDRDSRFVSTARRSREGNRRTKQPKAIR